MTTPQALGVVVVLLAAPAVVLYSCLVVAKRADRWADDQRAVGDWDAALQALSRATMTHPDWHVVRCARCGDWTYRDKPCATCAHLAGGKA